MFTRLLFSGRCAGFSRCLSSAVLQKTTPTPTLSSTVVRGIEAQKPRNAIHLPSHSTQSARTSTMRRRCISGSSSRQTMLLSRTTCARPKSSFFGVSLSLSKTVSRLSFVRERCSMMMMMMMMMISAGGAPLLSLCGVEDDDALLSGPFISPQSSNFNKLLFSALDDISSHHSGTRRPPRRRRRRAR